MLGNYDTAHNKALSVHHYEPLAQIVREVRIGVQIYRQCGQNKIGGAI